MNGIDIVLIVLLIGIFSAIIWFMHKSKKSGKKCIGCPESGKCGGNCNCK